MTDPRFVWFGIRHYSPACAWHVRQVIRRFRPVAVLVEGPDDATGCIAHLLDPTTVPPVTILSSYVDKKNTFGQNGVLSTHGDVPARYRGWWPFVAYSPEYVALQAGAEVGAELAFIDAPLRSTIPYHHLRRGTTSVATSDAELSANAYFEALARRQRRPSFDAFWEANFEVGGSLLDPMEFMRRVLLFAWCVRSLASGEALDQDGTLLREQHMRWHIDTIAKKHPEGRIVVVTGAFHAVALQGTRRKRARARADRNTQTVLTRHSFRALSNLYDQNRLPAHGQLVWELMEAGRARPFDEAAVHLLVAIQRRAREEGAAASTADTVAAYQAAHHLAALRGNAQITLTDLLDSVQMSYVKGEASLSGPPIHRATRAVLIGATLGAVTADAGQIPLVVDFYRACKEFRLDVSGSSKTVRCDVHKQPRHRRKSAFLHQAEWLEIPMFEALESAQRYERERTHFLGPDWVTKEDLHRITETWGIRWRESVDDRLLELSDHGASVAEAAGALLAVRQGRAAGDLVEATRLVLRATQMLCLDRFDGLMATAEDAMGTESQLERLAGALSDLVLLHDLRERLPMAAHHRLLAAIGTVYTRAVLALRSLGNTSDVGAAAVLDSMQSVVRIALTFRGAGLDRQLLNEQLRALAEDIEANATLRGAAFGVLFSLGRITEVTVARELEGYLLGSPDRTLRAGAFLDGLFATSKSIFMVSPRLLQAINRVLAELEWSTFKRILPDLRRAFTQFIPSELEAIGRHVATEIRLRPEALAAAVTPALERLGYRSDARVEAVLAHWMGAT